jgi:S-DNA-T family DNA segregation ATPase FtsK/SpoIIIE
MCAAPALHQARVEVARPDGDRVALVRFRNGGEATFGDLAPRLGLGAGAGFLVDGRRVDPAVPLPEAGLTDGSRLDRVGGGLGDAPTWTLVVVGGLDSGRWWPLPVGTSLIGSGRVADITLDDVAEEDAVTIHVSPDGSAVVVDAHGVATAPPGDPFRVARWVLTVARRSGPPARPRSGTTIPHRPTARPTQPPPPPPSEPSAPDDPPGPPPFAWISVLAPTATGILLAVMWSPRFALFAGLGPVMAIAAWFEQRRRHRRDQRSHRAESESRRVDHRRALDDHATAVAAHARRRLPTLPELEGTARGGGPDLWRGDGGLVVAAGWDGERPVDLTLRGRATVIVGPAPVAVGVVRHLLVQVAVSNPPGGLVIECDPEIEERLDAGGDWMGWLPHRGVAPSGGGLRLVVSGHDSAPAEPPGPDDAHLVIVADGQEPLPWTDATVTVDRAGTAVVQFCDVGRDGPAPGPILTAPIAPGPAARVARHLARWRVVSQDPVVTTSLPAVGVAELTGPLGDEPALLERWSRSAGADPSAGLPAPVGCGPIGPVTVDLVGHGPHVVIGGTTGSGKSELLRTLVASLCACHPPEVVAFVLVDYKGGSAFDGCADLPQVTTVVTDLDGSRTDRVLTAIDAELTRRERWLREHGRSDLAGAAELPDRPPRLVVMIDEFATLAHDRPDFLPALVGVARRGRSLGLHLVLATQRPAGAMTDDIRANTDIRIALRMTDPADSMDVIGAGDAARIPADRPGRACMRRGGGPVEGFQVATATTGEEDEVDLDVRWLDRRSPDDGAGPTARAGPTQLKRLAHTARAAVIRSGRSTATALWPPELPTELAPDVLDRSLDERAVAIGLVDDLTCTRHQRCCWEPTRGALALYGDHGSDLPGVVSGVIVALHRGLGPVHVYAADGAGELADWTGAGPVGAVVAADSRDGLRRLVARLERELHRRVPRGPEPLLVLVLHDLAALARALEDLDGLRLMDRVYRIVAEGPRRGIATVVTAPRPGMLAAPVAGAVDRCLALRLAVPDDYRLIGLRPPSPPLPRGRALDEQGRSVQLTRVEAPELAPFTPTTVGDRPRGLDPLPPLVSPGSPAEDVDPDPWGLPVGVDHDGPATLRLPSGSPTIVAGPPGSGRTTALRLIADQSRRRGATVMTVGPDGSVAAHDQISDQVGAEKSALAAHLRGLLRAGSGPDSNAPPGLASMAGREPRVLVLVDDATEVEDGDGVLHRLARGRWRSPGLRLVMAVDPVERRLAYGHWTSSLRRCRSGIALHHDPEEDRDLWSDPLPPAPTGRPPPGRGLLMADGEVPIEIQVARP